MPRARARDLADHHYHLASFRRAGMRIRKRLAWPHVSLRWQRRQMPDASLEHYSLLPFNPIRPRWAIRCELIRSPTVPLCSVHGADQLRGRSSEKMLGRIEHELSSTTCASGKSYNPPLSDQKTEIAFERHYVSIWSARLDFAQLCKIILAALNADGRTYAA